MRPMPLPHWADGNFRKRGPMRLRHTWPRNRPGSGPQEIRINSLRLRHYSFPPRHGRQNINRAVRAPRPGSPPRPPGIARALCPKGVG